MSGAMKIPKTTKDFFTLDARKLGMNWRSEKSFSNQNPDIVNKIQISFEIDVDFLFFSPQRGGRASFWSFRDFVWRNSSVDSQAERRGNEGSPHSRWRSGKWRSALHLPWRNWWSNHSWKVLRANGLLLRPHKRTRALCPRLLVDDRSELGWDKLVTHWKLRINFTNLDPINYLYSNIIATVATLKTIKHLRTSVWFCCCHDLAQRNA